MNFKWQKQMWKICNTVRIRKQEGHESIGEKEMTSTMTCRMNGNEVQRFREVRKRLFNIPLSEKKILRTMGKSDIVL